MTSTNHLDVLLSKVDDPTLRAQLEREVERLRDDRQFGLVFERHLPETVRLYTRPVRRGVPVQVREEKDGPTWWVKSKSGDKATLERTDDGETITEVRSVDELVVVAEFGQAVYPGFKSVGTVERGGDKPFHTVINGENYHAIEALAYAYEGQVDAIYIDPPYNTGARDWKYNNDYVQEDDTYRHSKWLSFMEKRLKAAKRLLNPTDSVLIVTIDEKEYLRLGMLLEQVFRDARIQMTTIVINPKGTARYNEFARVDEYAFFVFIGGARLHPSGSDMLTDRNYSEDSFVRWRGLARTGRKGLRSNNPGSWYPIFVRTVDGSIHSIGDPISPDVDEATVAVPSGTVAVWPQTKNAQEYSWSVVAETLRDIHSKGGLKLGQVDVNRGKFPFYYLSSGAFEKIASGAIVVKGQGTQGELIIEYAEGAKSAMPRSVWNQTAHDAGSHGTNILKALIPGRSFPFPKSLYAVEDALRFFVTEKPNALVIDFFGGSGTTAHAVMRLNRQDGGSRRSIVVTNNEVSDGEAKALTKSGHRPGDPEWEAQGIFEHITRPRIEAAVTGLTPAGEPVVGDYKFTGEFPMAEGFEENVEFLQLTYEDPAAVSLGRAFEAIAPLLWMKAGATGPRIDKIPTKAWALPKGATYGVLFSPGQWRGFLDTVAKRDDVRHVFVVTDSEAVFQQVVSEVPAGIETTMLYEDYLSTFAVNQAGES